MDKKILVACLSTRTPVLALAGWKDQLLHIISIKPLPTSRTALDAALIPELEANRSKGFDIVIDEAVPRLSVKHGRPARLSDVDPVSGRPVLVDALQGYNELKRQKAITFPAGGESRYDIPASLVDEERDTNGRYRYNVDWDALKPEAAALLLCVYAANSTPVSSDLYLSALMGALSPQKRPDSPASRFEAVTTGYDRARAAEYPVYAGKDGCL